MSICESKDIRLSDNPITDPGRGGIPRFVLIARLEKVEILNGSEVNLVSCVFHDRPVQQYENSDGDSLCSLQVSIRERKESEIRCVFSSNLIFHPNSFAMNHFFINQMCYWLLLA